eukprot:2098169-Pleurochrysis_carterae.AAC.3
MKASAPQHRSTSVLRPSVSARVRAVTAESKPITTTEEAVSVSFERRICGCSVFHPKTPKAYRQMSLPLPVQEVIRPPTKAHDAMSVSVTAGRWSRTATGTTAAACSEASTGARTICTRSECVKECPSRRPDASSPLPVESELGPRLSCRESVRA